MTVTNLRSLPCLERNEYLQIGTPQAHEGWGVESSLTDLDGNFGEPRIETTWQKGEVRVQDIRYPALFDANIASAPKDVKPCEHYYWEGSKYDED